MSLTASQLATLKADIQLNFPSTPDADVAAAYNLNASPDYWVWRTSVSKAEYINSVSVDGTTFNWTGAGFITRSQGERDAWNQMFMVPGQAVNPSLANVRQAFQDIFSGGTAPAPANRTHLATVSRRKARRIEKLLVASGAGTTADPAVMGYEGEITPGDVAEARLP